MGCLHFLSFLLLWREFVVKDIIVTLDVLGHRKSYIKTLTTQRRYKTTRSMSSLWWVKDIPSDLWLWGLTDWDSGLNILQVADTGRSLSVRERRVEKGSSRNQGVIVVGLLRRCYWKRMFDSLQIWTTRLPFFEPLLLFVIFGLEFPFPSFVFLFRNFFWNLGD